MVFLGVRFLGLKGILLFGSWAVEISSFGLLLPDTKVFPFLNYIYHIKYQYYVFIYRIFNSFRK